MAGRRICILVATFDAICFNIILDLLTRCAHEVLHTGGPIETLSAICERKDIVGVVLTNLHRIQSQVTADILHHIEKKLRVQTCFMSPDNTRMDLTAEGVNGGFAAYIVHSMDNIDLLGFWTMSSIKSTEVPRFMDITSHIMSSSFSLASASTSESASDTAAVDGDDSKMLWIEEIARKFLMAIYTLPPRDIVPKKILEHMGRPAGLERKHVSSHLQKHRLRAKKNVEAMKKKADVSARTGVSPAPPMPFGGPYYNYLISRFGAPPIIRTAAPNLVIREAPPNIDQSQTREMAPPNVSDTDQQAPLQNISDNPSWQQQTVLQVDENENNSALQQQQAPTEAEDIDWHIQNFWDEAEGPPSLELGALQQRQTVQVHEDENNSALQQQAPAEADDDNARQQQQAPEEEDNARQQPARAEDDEDIDWHIQNFWDEDEGPPSLD